MGGRDGEKVLAREPEPCANRTCLGLIAVSPESIHECLHGFRAISQGEQLPQGGRVGNCGEEGFHSGRDVPEAVFQGILHGQTDAPGFTNRDASGFTNRDTSGMC